MDTDYIVKRITELRLKKGVAEHRMSLDLGHSRSYMQGISSGRALPSMTEFLAICDYLEVTPKDFFDEGNTNPTLLQATLDKLKGLPESDLLIIYTMAERLQK
ncbi:MAG: helix-turn-helix transcriptional regulator [Hungatella sp.]|nr:helix-turn-helix transcriptional regulator [Hungatella sp.]